MNDLEEFNYINALYDLYGSLLTKNQILVMDSYYKFNLSLAEISEEKEISRSAVLDTLKHAKEKLIEYENKLNLYKRNLKLINIINESNIDENIKKEMLEVL